MLKRDLRTTFDLLKPSSVKDVVQTQQEKQVGFKEQKGKERVFTAGESVLVRNYRGEPKWIPATVIAQTGPVSYTVQTADSVWRRHVDQVRQTPSVPAVTVLGNFPDAPLCLHSILQPLEAPATYARVVIIDYRSAFNAIVPITLFGKLQLMGINHSVVGS
jgi:hypothetical protein